MIGSTITYRGGVKWLSPYESVVGEWAYVKELATMNTKKEGEWGSIKRYIEGKCSERWQKGGVHSKEMGKNVTGVLVS